MRFQTPTVSHRLWHRIVFGWVLLAAVLIDGGRAEIIDRMVAIVDGRVVNLSDMDRYRVMAEFFGDRVPEDPAALLDDVIEDLLIQDEIDQFRQISVGQELVDQFVAELPLLPELALDEVREAVRKRLERVNYFNARFRRFIGATEQEIAAYYEAVFIPAAQARGLDPVPELGAIVDLITENVVTEKTDRQIETWTDSLVRRSDVELVTYVE